MDGPMIDKYSTTNAINPKGLIEEVLQTDSCLSDGAHKIVCPIISMDERSEDVDQLITQHEKLINIFKGKRAEIESLANLDFNGLLARLTKQNNMSIVTEIAEYIGLGVPKICQVLHPT